MGDEEDPWKDAVTPLGTGGAGGVTRPKNQNRNISYHSFPNSPAPSIRDRLSEIETDGEDTETGDEFGGDHGHVLEIGRWKRFGTKAKKVLKGVNELYVV